MPNTDDHATWTPSYADAHGRAVRALLKVEAAAECLRTAFEFQTGPAPSAELLEAIAVTAELVSASLFDAMVGMRMKTEVNDAALRVLANIAASDRQQRDDGA